MYLPRPYYSSSRRDYSLPLDDIPTTSYQLGLHDACETETRSTYTFTCSDSLLARLIASIKAPWASASPSLPLSSSGGSGSGPQSNLRLRRRDDLQTQNITIGVVVGIFLTIFLVALFYFLHRYSASIRVRKKRRSRHGRRGSRAGSGSSKASASSTSTQGSAPPEAPEAPEPAPA